jgi:hypothetical protein
MINQSRCRDAVEALAREKSGRDVVVDTRPSLLGTGAISIAIGSDPFRVIHRKGLLLTTTAKTFGYRQ